jgi:hypothetical protein
MTDAVITNDPDHVKIVAVCGCAFVLVKVSSPDVNDKGVSVYLCAEHSDEGMPAIVIDVDVTTIHDPFAWDYQVTPERVKDR